ncbi:GntG family PLP-dependent aldolase [Nocardia jiangsuensis]|uniref:GntG family PLP-dependent aldolase n=1 Tax=Nocardia jiangsuensis TaxID=1691563 RepID=A0ABV8E099_9NOCA
MTIELRSDTFTLPSADMRRAMADAELGDDCYGEDPTVRQLEELAAELVGQPDALFLPSGTMANLCGILAQADRGRAVIAGHRSDVYHFEAGGPAVLGGTSMRAVPNLPDGTLDPAALLGELALDRTDSQYAVPALVCVETSHNMCGGVPLSPGYLQHVRATADEHRVRLHIDGARLFNAAVALGVPASETGAVGDSLQFCLSKGLGAPVGSILAASVDTVDRARRLRKMLGGGMRQAGVLAAAGLLALKNIEERLAADHANAAEFARRLAESAVLEVRHGGPVTNIVLFRVAGIDDHQVFVERCAESGLRLFAWEPEWVRAVFHAGVTSAEAIRAADIARLTAEKLA